MRFLPLFEILHHDSFGGKLPNLEYDLDDLKFRLRLKYTEKSAEVDRYPNYKDFRVRVLEQVQKDCHAYTDLAFTFEGVRKGRRIAAVVFDVRRKLQPKLLEVPDGPAANPLEELEKWAGSAYRSARNVTLLERLPDLFPSEIGDVARFAEQNEFFGALSAEDKQAVLANLRPL